MTIENPILERFGYPEMFDLQGKVCGVQKRLRIESARIPHDVEDAADALGKCADAHEQLEIAFKALGKAWRSIDSLLEMTSPPRDAGIRLAEPPDDADSWKNGS